MWQARSTGLWKTVQRSYPWPGTTTLAIALLIVVVAYGAFWSLSTRLSAVGTGTLTFLEVHNDGLSGVEGLDRPRSVAVSPDGKSVYTVGRDDDSVTVFQRNTETGGLTFFQVLKNGEGGVIDMNSPHGVTVSPDGENVYVAVSIDGAVVVFDRNVNNGGLGFLESQKQGLSFGAFTATVSSDGNFVYVGTVDQGLDPGSIAVFGRNGSTGALTLVQTVHPGVDGVQGLAGVMSMVISPNGDHLYAVGGPGINLFDQGTVTVFSRNESTGVLTYVEFFENGVNGAEGLAGSNSVALSPNGGHLYVSARDDDSIAVFDRGLVTGTLTFSEHYRDGVDGFDALQLVSSLAISPDGSHLYAVSPEETISVFSRDSTTGGLSVVEVLKDDVDGIDGLRGPVSVALSPDGESLYVVSELEDAVAVFDRDFSEGISFIESEQNGVAGIDGLGGAWASAVSPDGKFVYVAGNDDDAIAVFMRDGSGGTLGFLGLVKDGVGGVDGLNGVRSLVITTDGRHLYAAGFFDDAVAVFERDLISGTLTFVERQQNGLGGIEGLDGAWSVAASPDGKHIYVAGSFDSSLSVFSRNSVTGALTFIESRKDGMGGIDGIGGIRSVAVSHDGKHVYGAGFSDNGIAVFNRNATTGSITFQGFHAQGAGGITGLSGVNSITISPDDNHVYTTSLFDQAVAVFERHLALGTLTFVEAEIDGAGGVNGIGQASSLAVNPDGQHVYVTGPNDDAVAVFGRNSTSGALSFEEFLQNGVSGVEGLLRARGVAVSPDGQNLYVTSFSGHGVSLFSSPTTTVLPDPGPTPTATVAPTQTPTPAPTATTVPTVTPTPVPTLSSTASPVPTASATPTLVATPTPSETAVPISVPTTPPSASTSVPRPTAAPIATSTAITAATATTVPTQVPTPTPQSTVTPVIQPEPTASLGSPGVPGDDGGTPAWVWIVVVLGTTVAIGALVGGGLFVYRRGI